ncbi:DNA mismatch repair protein [Nocardia africana]|uniref:DNA mismatch repair protein n=1 Tax=Nocardia africana TaxID=134964 RepID=A0ABW6NNF7_9NOCA
MRVRLLYPGDTEPAPITLGDTTVADLGMSALFDTIADSDPAAADAVRAVIAAASADPAVIAHRHAVLTDCCAHPHLVRAVHDIATAATSVRRWASSARRRANGTLVLTPAPFTEQLELLRRLRTLLERDGDPLTAAGWTDLIATTTQFDDTYLHAVRDELNVLRFDHGVEIEAGLGPGNKITDVVVHRPPPPRRTRFGLSRSTSVFEAIADGDVNSDPVMQLKDHALAELADVVAAAADRLHAFFLRLREETAFYLGCLILRERLDRTAIPYCLPHPHPPGTARLRCRGLRDLTLALGPAPASVAGSDLLADGRSLLIVTGANNGGKSTFLRSLGAAQLMMQAGMFVLAEEFAADVRDGVFTHFAGDEDHTLSYGRLADELVRMNAVIDRFGPHGLLLCNEAFASTGERDAGRIAGPLLRALTEAGAKVVFVTHLYDYARTRHAGAHPGDLFLRADRGPDGARTHRIVPGAPEPGGHGYDLWAATELETLGH